MLWTCRTCGRELDAGYPAERCFPCLDKELTKYQAFVESRGYRRCDIPACNCDSWHGGHAEERLREIRQALGDPNGVTTLKAVENLRAAALEEAARLVQTYHEYPSTNDQNIAAAIRELTTKR